MTAEWRETRAAFHAAADWFATAVEKVGGRWSSPGLGEWDVRALVGHTSRALLTVESYLATPAPTVAVDSAVAYYHATREIARGPGVAQRGRDAGSALGNDPVSAVATIVDRVNTLVADRDGAELLTTIAGGMRLSDYLPTRVFELVVHTADLCTALDQPADPPPIAAALALRLAGDLVVADGRAADVLLALCGRRPLPAGFTVL
jgi:uncharacterized protein (TIGR03083 family)